MVHGQAHSQDFFYKRGDMKMGAKVLSEARGAPRAVRSGEGRHSAHFPSLRCMSLVCMLQLQRLACDTS